jgi:prepilin-type N-terminal cleavage/methylation domain-containing protein
MFLNKRKMQIKNKAGFTLIEILLVLALIGILLGIIAFAINPGKQLAEARNIRRQSDCLAILDAIQQYLIDTRAADLSNIPTDSPGEICKKDPENDCTGLIDLDQISSDRTYISIIPEDPDGSENDPEDGTGYFIIRSAVDNRVTVLAPQAERGLVVTYSK